MARRAIRARPGRTSPALRRHLLEHEGGDGGYITLNGVTDGGRRSAVVSLSEARGDTPEHILDQENAAGGLIDHALCAV